MFPCDSPGQRITYLELILALASRGVLACLNISTGTDSVVPLINRSKLREILLVLLLLLEILQIFSQTQNFTHTHIFASSNHSRRLTDRFGVDMVQNMSGTAKVL